MFTTYHFGVNNKWWFKYRSILGKPWYERYKLITNYRMVRFRACHCCFVDEKTAGILYPRYYAKLEKEK